MTLSPNKVYELFFFDPVTGNFTHKKSSPRAEKGARAGWLDRAGYMCLRIDGRDYKAHRIAWLLYYGNLPNFQIDHIDGCKSNNRVSNLRLANNSENQQNIPSPRKNNKSGRRGVFWKEKNKRWLAEICVNGIAYYLGSFTDIEEAANAYLDAKKRLHPFYVAHQKESSV